MLICNYTYLFFLFQEFKKKLFFIIITIVYSIYNYVVITFSYKDKKIFFFFI